MEHVAKVSKLDRESANLKPFVKREGRKGRVVSAHWDCFYVKFTDEPRELHEFGWTQADEFEILRKR